MKPTPTAPAARSAPSSNRLWLEEALGGWILPVAAIAVVGGLALLYVLDILPERLAGLLMALAIVGTTSAVLLRDLRRAARSRAASLAALGLTVATLAVALAPIVTALTPGAPLATGELHSEGDSVPVPHEAAGHVRLWFHGAIAGHGASIVDFDVAGTAQPTRGRIERTVGRTRVGRRGSATVEHEHNSEIVSAELPKATEQLTLRRLHGPLTGALEVRVYRDTWPLPYEIAVALLVLLAVAALAARTGANISAVALAGIPLAFGIATYVFATPEEVVKPQIAALVVGAIGGAIAGAIAGWLLAKVVPHGQSESRANAH